MDPIETVSDEEATPTHDANVEATSAPDTAAGTDTPAPVPETPLAPSAAPSSEPLTTAPVATNAPLTTEPVAVEPAATEPAATDPVAVEPVTVEPAATEPLAVEPVAVEPSTVDSGESPPSTPPAAVAEDPGPAVAAPATPAIGAALATGTAVLSEAPRELRSGQIVEGKVLSVDAAEVVLQMGDGSTGVIGKRHLTANGQTDPTTLLSVGDGVEAAVLVRDDPHGRLVLSRAWALKQRAWEQVEAAKAANKPLTGRVTGQVKGGLVVDVGTRAFLPASQVDLHHVEDLASFVGQEIQALVQEADRVNDKVVLSRRNFMRSAQRSKAGELAATLAPGQVHRGRVALVTDFGAFVEIGGVRGLVHLSELSWSRVDRAEDVVTPGTEVEVKVLAIKPGKKLSLSIRALTEDPLAKLQQGQILPGVVTRLADFGAFVRVGDGAEGLVHVTELAEYRVHAPEEVVTPGDEVLVKVLRIDRKRRRLDLSVNQALLS